MEGCLLFLKRIILAEIEDPHEIVAAKEDVVHIRPDEVLEDEALNVERLAHHEFAEGLLRFFVGRTEILAKIDNYIKKNGSRSLAIVGAGGTGKSALMARATPADPGVLSKCRDRLPLHWRHPGLFRWAQSPG